MTVGFSKIEMLRASDLSFEISDSKAQKYKVCTNNRRGSLERGAGLSGPQGQNVDQ